MLTDKNNGTIFVKISSFIFKLAFRQRHIILILGGYIILGGLWYYFSNYYFSQRFPDFVKWETIIPILNFVYLILSTAILINAIRMDIYYAMDNERKYHTLSNQFMDVRWAVDLNTMKIIYASSNTEEVYGWTPNEALSLSLLQIMSPEMYQQVQEELPKQVEEFKQGNIEAVIKTYSMDVFGKYGDRIPTDVITAMTYQPDGKPIITGLIRGVSYQKRIEEEQFHYELMAANTLDIILFIREEDGRILDANPAAVMNYGYTHDEIVGLTVYDIRGANTIDQIASEMELADKGGILFETIHKRKDGSTFPVEVHSKGVILDGKTILISIVRDITRRKEDEKARIESETRYRKLFTTMTDGFALHEIIDDTDGIAPDFRYVEVNDSFCEITGLSREVFLTKNMRAIFPKEDWHYLDDFREVALNGKPKRIELFSRFLNQYYDLYIYCPQYGQFAAIMKNITHQKKSEEKLRKLSRAVECSPASVLITDLTGAIEYVNPRFTEVTGYHLDEVAGQKTLILRSPLTPLDTYTTAMNTMMAGGTWTGEFCNQKKDQDIYWEYTSISPITDEKGEITHFISVSEDITERKHLERELRQQRDFAVQVMNAMGQGLVVTDTEGKLEYVNPAFAHLLERNPEELIGQTLPLAIDSSGKARYQRRKKENTPASMIYETNLIRPDSSIIPVLISEVPHLVDGKYAGAIYVITDLTDQKRVEDQLRRLGTIDPLTGAYNRTFFEAELDRLQGEAGIPISIIVADVDNLKYANDNFGHIMGDQLLKLSVSVMKSALRGSDFIARIGGDEFAVILKNTTKSEADLVISRIENSIQLSPPLPNGIILSLSLGSDTTTDGRLVEALRSADNRMYIQKRLHKSAAVEE